MRSSMSGAMSNDASDSDSISGAPSWYTKNHVVSSQMGGGPFWGGLSSGVGSLDTDFWKTDVFIVLNIDAALILMVLSQYGLAGHIF
jgi:hypothetical protein